MPSHQKDPPVLGSGNSGFQFLFHHPAPNDGKAIFHCDSELTELDSTQVGSGGNAGTVGGTSATVVDRTNGSSSDSIKVNSRSRPSRTSLAGSRVRRPGGPGLDASSKRAPLRLPSVCVASMHLLCERTSEQISPGRSWEYLARMQPSSQTLVPELPLCRTPMRSGAATQPSF